MRMLFVSLFLAACEDTKEDVIVEEAVLQDADDDGYNENEDCDDLDAQINPSMDEICDGIDNNCNGEVDEGVRLTFYVDADEDGYGNPSISTEACEQPSGFVPTGTDCDDTSTLSYPSAEEICDGLDNDCDGEIDEGVTDPFYLDEDGDGFGDEAESIEACVAPEGYSNNGNDCDDQNADIYPGVLRNNVTTWTMIVMAPWTKR